MFFSILRFIGKGIFILIIALILTEFSLRLFGFFYTKRVANLYSASKKNNAKITILAVGESTTGGMWAENKSYPLQLQDMLNAYLQCSCASVYIHSMAGANTSGLLSQFDQKLLEYKPDVVLFMAGVNDRYYLAYNIDAIFLETYFKENKKIYDAYITLTRLLNEIRLFRLLKLIYTSFTLPKTTYLDLIEEKGDMSISRARQDFAERHGEFIDTITKKNIEKMVDITRMNKSIPIILTYHKAWINTVLKQIAAEKNVIFVDNEPPFKKELWKYVFKRDGWHPNEEGYKIIAENVMKTLINQRFLKKN